MQDKVISISDFPNREAFAVWLLENEIDISTWEQGAAKSVETLWQELQRGEITLTASPLQRHIHVVGLIIERNKNILMEVCQQFHDGRTRQRNLPPSEKLLVGESAESGAQRCLQEELGIMNHEIKIADLSQKTYLQESQSYPSVTTHYTMHYVTLTLPQLPNSDFTVPNLGKDDAVASHTWGWRPRPARYCF